MAKRKRPASVPIRTKLRYDPAIAEVVRNALKGGVALTTAALCAGVTADELRKWMQAHPTFRREVEQAEANTKLKVSTALVLAASKGNVSAQRFFLSRRVDEYRSTREDLIEQLEDPQDRFL